MSSEVAGFVRSIIDHCDLQALRALVDWLQEHASEPGRAQQLANLLCHVRLLTNRTRCIADGTSMSNGARSWGEFEHDLTHVFYFDLNPLDECLDLIARHGLPKEEPGPPDGAHAAVDPDDLEPDHVVDETAPRATYSPERAALNRFGESLIIEPRLVTLARGEAHVLPSGLVLHVPPGGSGQDYHIDGRCVELWDGQTRLRPPYPQGYVISLADRFEFEGRTYLVTARHEDGSVADLADVTRNDQR